jgi:hypothetical protein
MFLNVATLTQRYRVGNFSYTAIGKPNIVMCVPVLPKQFSAPLAFPVSRDVEMPFLGGAEKSHSGILYCFFLFD